MQTSQTTTQSRRFFRPSDFDREWAAREFDLAADARITRCRAAKVQRGRGPSRQDERDAAAMFAEIETARQEQLAEDRRIFAGQNASPWRSGGSFSREIVTTSSAKEPAVQPIVLSPSDFAGKPGICQICEECDFLDDNELCPEYAEIGESAGHCAQCLVLCTDLTTDRLCPACDLQAMEQSTPNQQRSFKGAL